MKKLILLPFIFVATLIYAQPRIVVQNGSASVYTNINDAILAANSGDTIYLPGGGFNISPVTIDKTLHWVGVGHYPDSTSATKATRIITSLVFTGNCDNSTFEGIYFTNSLSFGSSGNDAMNISIKRCRVGSTLNLRASSSDTVATNFVISESVMSTLNAYNASNCLIEKSMLFGGLNNFHQSFFDHNNFNYSGSYLLTYVNGCLFKNNIFSYYYGMRYTESCEFSYNLYSGALPYNPETSTHTGTNNITDVGGDNIYTTITGTNYSFSYDNDYKLKTGCPGIGAAEDGTDIGVYGTLLPYKEGAVPYYPHIRSVSVDSEASGGQLGVQITVAAQER
ncbi:hypothetical protein GM418_27820 [Maribellus comscasis]|uniref:Uncharacterized protein n=1 Tax=Maribellus comscasis TaxID=2681766 RepID=A0A6I6K409_9BACT|nr:hypothetical protein [Maribellus comscasis]QGY47337.1 hypothetical protein GM418_27820 [Maribellus comscasis]